MKKRCIAVVLCWVLIVSFLLPFRKKAYADPFTASQIASTAYAMMESWGIAFNAGSGTATGMNDFMSRQVEDFVNSKGGSIADVFVGQIAVDTAGKLVVGQEMYNSIVEFTDWIKDKFHLSTEDSNLSAGDYEGTPINKKIIGKSSWDGYGVGGYFEDFQTPTSGMSGPHKFVAMNGNTTLQVYSSGAALVYGGDYTVEFRNHNLYARVPYYYVHSGQYGADTIATLVTNAQIENTLSWNGTDFVEPTVLNPGKEWVGNIGGYSTPDTNLEQLLSGINQAVADNNLVVDGEVIDVPVPPTPVPTIEPGDIDGYWNRQADQMEGLGNDIGDISGHLDDIGDQIGDVTGALEGVQEGIQAQTGVISGAIDQAVQDVADAISEQTATLDQSLTETAEGVQDIAEALQPGDIEPKKFDLRGFFPFCIPFDIHNLLQKFKADPVAPHVQIPFTIQSIGFSYMIDLDFSAFDPVAAALRTVEFIVFAIGLAWATSKVIKW